MILYTEIPKGSKLHIRIISAVVRLIGLLFLVAGLSKIFAVSIFSRTISHIIPVNEAVASIFGIMVILTEVLCGLALLLNFKRRIASYILVFLIAVFLWVLISAILLGREFNCQCFGILGVSFSNPHESLFDILLLNILIVFLFVTTESEKTTPLSKRIIGLIIPVLFVGMGDYALISTIVRSIHNDVVQEEKIRDYLSEVFPNEMASHESMTFFFLRLPDFSCSLCFDDFSLLSDSLSSSMTKPDHARRLFAIVAKDEITQDSIRIEAWKSANNISYTTIVVPESVFMALGIRKSIAITYFQGGKGMSHHHIFPGSEESRREIFRAMK